MAQLSILHHWFRLHCGAVQETSHYLNQWCLIYWRIYASLGLNELNCKYGCQTNVLYTTSEEWLSNAYQVQWNIVALLTHRSSSRVTHNYVTKLEPLSQPVMAYCQPDPSKQISMTIVSKHTNFHSWKLISNVVCKTVASLSGLNVLKW